MVIKDKVIRVAADVKGYEKEVSLQLLGELRFKCSTSIHSETITT